MRARGCAWGTGSRMPNDSDTAVSARNSRSLHSTVADAPTPVGMTWSVLPPPSDASVDDGSSGFLDDHGYANRRGLHDLDQRVGNIDVGGEDGTAAGSSCVDGIGGRSVDFLDVMSRARNRDACRIGLDLNFLVVRNSSYARMNLDLAGRARIEGKVQLAGDNLNDSDIAGVANLLRSQVEGSVTGLDVQQFDFRVDLVCLQLADDALRAAHTDLGLRNHLGTYLKLRWD